MLFFPVKKAFFEISTGAAAACSDQQPAAPSHFTWFFILVLSSILSLRVGSFDSMSC